MNLPKKQRTALMRRWNNRTSFISRLSRRFPTYTFAELVALMKQRSRATYIARYVRKVLKEHPELAFTCMGTDWRDHWWTDPWWKTWKSQWELASNQSLRSFYGLKSNEDDIPLWTRFAKHRVALPTADDLKEWQIDANNNQVAMSDEEPSDHEAMDELKRSLAKKNASNAGQKNKKKPFGQDKGRQDQSTQRQKNQNKSAAGLLFSSMAKDKCKEVDVDLSDGSDFGSTVQKLIEQEVAGAELHEAFEAE